ncbi:unnamed protein product, partial [Polarella glacialis]
LGAAASGGRARMDLGNSLRFDERVAVAESPSGHVTTPRDYNRHHSPSRPPVGMSGMQSAHIRFDNRAQLSESGSLDEATWPALGGPTGAAEIARRTTETGSRRAPGSPPGPQMTAGAARAAWGSPAPPCRAGWAEASPPRAAWTCLPRACGCLPRDWDRQVLLRRGGAELRSRSRSPEAAPTAPPPQPQVGRGIAPPAAPAAVGRGIAPPAAGDYSDDFEEQAFKACSPKACSPKACGVAPPAALGVAPPAALGAGARGVAPPAAKSQFAMTAELFGGAVAPPPAAPTSPAVPQLPPQQLLPVAVAAPRPPGQSPQQPQPVAPRLDILDMRRKLDEEERRLSEAKLMPIQLQVQELEARRLQEQGQVRQMELQYQLRQSELQQ